MFEAIFCKLDQIICNFPKCYIPQLIALNHVWQALFKYALLVK